MLGVGALAAVPKFFPVMFLVIAFTIGLRAGASVLIDHLLPPCDA